MLRSISTTSVAIELDQPLVADPEVMREVLPAASHGRGCFLSCGSEAIFEPQCMQCGLSAG